MRQNINKPVSPGQSPSGQPTRLWPSYFQALTLSLLVALLAGLTIWKTDNALSHAVSELGCIFVALGIFFATWYGRDWGDSPSLTLGLGYLAVAMLDGFHTYFFPTMQTAPPNAFDLGSWFWVWGRLLEACILYCAVRSSVRRNRTSALLLTVCGSAVFSLVLIRFSHLLPRLLTESGGVTPVKRWLECAIIAVLVAAWRSVSRAGSDQMEYMRPWILLSISCTITSELCLAGYGTLTGFLHAFGHSLKAASHYFLFLGTFALSIRLPFERLAAAEHDLGSLLNNLPLGIVTTSDTGRVSFANTVALSLLQGDSADDGGQKLERSLARLAGAVSPSETQASKVQEDLATANILPDGRSLRIDSVTLPEGNQVVFLEEDASVLRQRRLRLQARNILNALSDLCVLIDQQRLILACNDAFLRLVGLPASEVEGTDFDRLWRYLGGTEGSPDRPSKLLREHLVRGDDGEARSLLVRCTEIDEPTGVGRVQMIVGSDVTRLRSQDNRMRQEENQAAIGQTAAGLVHEIRNPLTAVKGYNQLLGLSLTDRRLSEYSSTVQEEITALQSIVSELLEFSKPRPPDLRAYALRDLIGPLQTLVESHVFLQGIELSVDLSSSELSVQVDKSQLQQVLLTAVRYCCEASVGMRSPQLSIRAEAGTLDEALVTLCCLDRSADEETSGSAQSSSPEPMPLTDLDQLAERLSTEGYNLRLERLYGEGVAVHLALPLSRHAEIVAE